MILSFRGVAEGARRTGAFLLSVLPFGLAFGAAAREAGLSTLEAMLMSMLVTAGAAQFAALSLWAAPLPVLPILLTTLLVNARHLPMGASLQPWLSPLPPWRVYGTMTLLSDVNWAMAMRSFAGGGRDAGLLLGSGLVLWLGWIAGTLCGHLLGGGWIDPRSLGLDVVNVAFFASVLVGLWSGRSDALPWAVAAGVACAAAWVLPDRWYVLAGGLAGALAGALRRDA